MHTYNTNDIIGQIEHEMLLQSNTNNAIQTSKASLTIHTFENNLMCNLFHQT